MDFNRPPKWHWLEAIFNQDDGRTLSVTQPLPAFRDASNNLPLAPDTKLVISDEFDALATNLVAAVFKNKDGNPLAPGTEILSKSEAEALVPSTSEIAGVFKNKDGNPLPPGTTLLSESEVGSLIPNDSEIASLFKDKNADPLAPGVKLMSAEEMLEAIKLAICDGCGGGGAGSGGAVSTVPWNPSSNTLSVGVDNGSGGTVNKTVTLSGLVSGGSSYAGSVPHTTGSELPLAIVGHNRAKLLRAQTTWLSVEVIGAPRVVPRYAL
jgi:hypothetical protein